MYSGRCVATSFPIQCKCFQHQQTAAYIHTYTTHWHTSATCTVQTNLIYPIRFQKELTCIPQCCAISTLPMTSLPALHLQKPVLAANNCSAIYSKSMMTEIPFSGFATLGYSCSMSELSTYPGLTAGSIIADWKICSYCCADLSQLRSCFMPLCIKFCHDSGYSL